MRGLSLVLILLIGCGGAVAIPDDSDATATDSTTSSTDTSAGNTDTPTPRPDAPMGTEGGRPLVCSDPTTFPKFIKGCTTSENCSFGLHQIDCCGSQTAIGFNHSERERFDVTEKAWRSTCPVCDCREKPTTAEDGKSGTSFDVRCVDGMCQTFVR